MLDDKTLIPSIFQRKTLEQMNKDEKFYPHKVLKQLLDYFEIDVYVWIQHK